MNDLPPVVELLLAFNLGLASQLHCIGMCGGVVGALALAVAPDAVARHGWLRFALAYNAGRVTSYVMAGLLLGLLGQRLGGLLPGDTGYSVLRAAALLALVITGLRLLDLPLPGATLARFPARAWARLRRPAQRLLPLRSLGAAFLFGMIWGWLPCAMVYATLALATGSASPGGGALVMLAFGAGTSPAMIAALTLAGRVPGALRRPLWRRLAGGLLLVGALVYAVLTWPGPGGPSGVHEHHHGHHHGR